MTTPTVDERSTRSPHVWLIVVVLVSVLVTSVGVVALFVVAWSSAHPLRGAAALTMNDDGTIDLITRQCPGRGLGAVEVVRLDDRRVLFSARLRSGATPRSSIRLDDSADPDYDKQGSLADLPNDVVVEPATLRDDRGSEIGTTRHMFRRTDLAQGQAFDGLTIDLRPTASQPMSTFLSTPLEC